MLLGVPLNKLLLNIRTNVHIQIPRTFLTFSGHAEQPTTSSAYLWTNHQRHQVQEEDQEIPLPKNTLQLFPRDLKAFPQPEGIHAPPSKFWICCKVLSEQDMPGRPLERANQVTFNVFRTKERNIKTQFRSLPLCCRSRPCENSGINGDL